MRPKLMEGVPVENSQIHQSFVLLNTRIKELGLRILGVVHK